MIPILLEQFIIEAFQDIPGEGFWTLAEADFSDDRGAPFRFPHYPYDYSNYFHDDNMATFIEDIEHWDKKHKEAALHAVTHNTPMVNPYPNWQDISYEYINSHNAGFFFCNKKTYYFYSPSAMLGFLKFYKTNHCIGTDSWCEILKYRLKDNTLEKFLSPFNFYQLFSVVIFLSFYLGVRHSSTKNNDELYDVKMHIEKLLHDHFGKNTVNICPLTFLENNQNTYPLNS